MTGKGESHNLAYVADDMGDAALYRTGQDNINCTSTSLRPTSSS